MNIRLVAVWCALAAAPAFAAERTIEQVVDADAVEIRNLVGNVRLVPGDAPMRVIARVTADDPGHAEAVRLSTGEAVRVSTGEAGSTTRLAVEYPEDVKRLRVDLEEFRRLDVDVRYMDRKVRLDDGSGDRVRVDLEITVPEGTRLKVTQEAGSVFADQVVGELALRSRFGGVSVTDGRGFVIVDTGSGTASVAGFRGDVTADAGSGTVIVENVLGKVRADTGSGQIRIRGIEGDVEADAGSGSVRIVDVAAAEVRADTGSGSIRFQDVRGSLFVDTGSGGVRGEGLVAGPRVEVDTGSGGVELRGDLGGVERVQIDTGSGSVEFASTTPLSLRLDLEASSGGIDVDIPALSDVNARRGSFRAVAGTGRGYAKIDTGSGGIRVGGP